MERVQNTEKLPVKLWLEDIEDGAMKQAINLAYHPSAFHHIVIMPDSHRGYGMPIGGVLATRDTVIPEAVGVDIGCGMCAIPTSIMTPDKAKLRRVMELVRERVPVGFSHHVERQSGMPSIVGIGGDIVDREYESATKQIGTLGGGNHFIELQMDEEGRMWVMIHSGSRNIGYQVAKHYKEVADTLCKKWYHNELVKQRLSFLPIDSDEGRSYLAEMKYCLEFAKANRALMLSRVLESIGEVFSNAEVITPAINKCHNFVELENHFGKNVWVHRKGATRAREGEMGIIPGSQGTASYIVSGRGERESFTSCSHGAGRVMSRKQAQRELSVVSEVAKLDAIGVIHSIRGKKDLDEAPSAYKNIDVVMENQKDLVEIVRKLTPLAVIKG